MRDNYGSGWFSLGENMLLAARWNLANTSVRIFRVFATDAVRLADYASLMKCRLIVFTPDQICYCGVIPLLVNASPTIWSCTNINLRYQHNSRDTCSASTNISAAAEPSSPISQSRRAAIPPAGTLNGYTLF